jgi:hypothetical protein
MTSERMKRYIEQQHERGFKLVSVWIPEDRAESLRKTADRWRRERGYVTVRANTIYRNKGKKK